MDASLLRILTRPGALSFPDNCTLAERFEAAGGTVRRHKTGHVVFYRPDGRRLLATDPSGHPLHECEWGTDARGGAILTRARLQLDWGRWVGLKPGGMVNETRLNLATRPGWQRLTPEDLRHMAAQAMRVPIDEVRFFYGDEDLVIDGQGQATIRHRKDAFYVLEDGTFESARFMSCMGAMHWSRIDFLPVVELFKSLLPGTGSAAFELIRGLYDDQQEGQAQPSPLRYRGIPTYPSEAAFRLFSSFFTPTAVSGDPLALFMDQSRAHQMTWTPAPQPPVRYFHDQPAMCLTVQGEWIQKVTLADDPMGLAYPSPAKRRVMPWDRSVTVRGDGMELMDRGQTRHVAVNVSAWQPMPSGPVPAASPVDWRGVFHGGVPAVAPGAVYGAVLLYPYDETPIGELAAQPFVADYLQDLTEQDREIGQIVARAERVLIDNGDAVISTCLPFDRPREVVAVIRQPAFAIKQAQQIWALCAELHRWEWLTRTRFFAGMDVLPAEWRADLAYGWVPYEQYDDPAALARLGRMLAGRLAPAANAFIVGPARFGADLAKAGLSVCWDEAVERLPTFGMHKTILPKARLRSGLTLFHARRG